MTADANIIIGIKGQLDGGKRIKRTLNDVKKSANDVTRETERLDRQMVKTNRTAQLFGRALGAIGGTIVVRTLGRVSDQFTVIDTNIKNVTSSSQEYDRVFNSLFKTAQKNGDVFSGLAETYQKLNVSLEDSVRQSIDLTKVTEILSRGFAASGTNAQTAAGASLQLTQGLATNFKAAGQELNSIIEGAPLLAKAIAVELGGKGATDLKKFAEEGTLTAQSFLEAMIRAEGAINAFAIPPTIDRAIQRVRNEFVRLTGQSETMRAASRGVAEGFNFVAENMDTLFKTMAIGFGAFTGYIAATYGLTAAVTAASGAVGIFNAVLLANPIGLVIAALGAAGTAFFVFRDEIFETLSGVEIFGVGVTDVFFTIKNAAIEIFSSLVDIILTPFKLIMAGIKDTLREAILLANKLPKVNIPVPEASENVLAETFKRVGGTGQRIAERTRVDINEFQNTLNQKDNKDNVFNRFKNNSSAGAGGKNSFKNAAARTKKAAIPEEYRELERVIASTRTEQETLIERIEELNKLKGFAKTAEEVDAIDRALMVANQQLETASTNIPNLKDGFEELREGVKDFSNTAGDAFGQVITGAKSAKEAISDLLTNTAQQLASEGFSNLTNTLLGSLFGSGGGGAASGGLSSIVQGEWGGLGKGIGSIFGGGGGLGGIASTVGSLFGFNSGGDMVLGGNGGIDNNIISLNGRPIANTSRGETMSIRPAGTSGNNGGGVTVVQHINVSTGVQETVQAELVAFLPTIEKTTKAAIMQDKQRGIS